MRISWDDPGSRLYEAGVDRGVFYPATGPGVPWNGLTSVKESSDDPPSTIIYVDGEGIFNQIQLGTFTADISAITYPDEMLPYDGFVAPIHTGQRRPTFNLTYRSMAGNDSKGLSYGYRLHLIYNCVLTPTNRTNNTLNDKSDISDFTWGLGTVPVATPYHRPTSHVIVDSWLAAPAALEALENLLYGTEAGNDPTFPSMDQLLDIFEGSAIFIVTNHGDGTVTISGPTGWVDPIGTDYVHLDSPSLNQIDETHILATSY